MPWDFLRQAAERRAAVAIVLDRTPPDAVETVSTHLARMLASRGLKDSPLFTVTEGEVDDEGLLPPETVADIRGWLDSLAGDAEARAQVVKQTLDGAIRILTRRTHAVADAATEQVDAERRLRETRTGPTTRPSSRSPPPPPTAPCCGARCWPDGRSSSAPASCCAASRPRVGWLRDRIVNVVKGQPQQAERVTVAVESGLETLILEHAEAAAERAEASWRSLGSGQYLLADAGEDLGRASRDFRRRAERAVRDWQ